MQPHPDRPPVARLSPMPLLFARYVAGQITDPFWRRCMQILDDTATPKDERLALAAFLNDAFAELSPDAVEMPKTGEVKDLLADARPPERAA